MAVFSSILGGKKENFESLNMDVLLWAYEKYDMSGDISETAAMKGDFEKLEWLKTKNILDVNKAYEGASIGGKIDVIKWLYNLGNTELEWSYCNKAAFKESAEHLEILKWSYDNGYKPNERACKSAAEGGSLNALKYLREKGCPWDKSTFEKAAMNGNLELFKWILNNNCPISNNICTIAAQSGHLAVLECAVDNNFICDENTFEAAALEGRKDILEYLLKKGCTWNDRIYDSVVRYECFNIFKWLIEENAPCDLVSYNWMKDNILNERSRQNRYILALDCKNRIEKYSDDFLYEGILFDKFKNKLEWMSSIEEILKEKEEERISKLECSSQDDDEGEFCEINCKWYQ